jgi:hypothetical protein
MEGKAEIMESVYSEMAAEVDVRPYMAVLDIQVLYVERVFFDELPAGFDVFTHQRGEDGLALGDVFESHR